FPSTGSFAIPVMGYQPAMAVPLTPNTFVALVARDALIKQIEDMIRTPTTIGTFSMLGGGVEHKLVVPAWIAEHNDPKALVMLLTNLRRDGRRLFNLIGKAAKVAGLRAYGYNEEL